MPYQATSKLGKGLDTCNDAPMQQFAATLMLFPMKFNKASINSLSATCRNSTSTTYILTSGTSTTTVTHSTTSETSIDITSTTTSSIDIDDTEMNGATGITVIFERLLRLHPPCGLRVIDERRFMDTLAMVCDEDDPHGFVFMQMFLRECEEDYKKLNVTVGEGNAVGTSAICHRWIGRCAQMGLVGLEESGRQLQREAKSGAKQEQQLATLLLMGEHLESVRNAIAGMVP